MSIRVHFSEITDWRLADHQDYRSKPRDTWKEAGKERTRGPVPLPQDTGVTSNARSKPKARLPQSARRKSKYQNVFQNCYGKWRCQFSYRGRKQQVGTFATEDEAAEAYNRYLDAHDIDRPYLVIERSEREDVTGERQALVICEGAG